jgi:hypothetical protein
MDLLIALRNENSTLKQELISALEEIEELKEECDHRVEEVVQRSYHEIRDRDLAHHAQDLVREEELATERHEKADLEDKNAWLREQLEYTEKEMRAIHDSEMARIQADHVKELATERHEKADLEDKNARLREQLEYTEKEMRADHDSEISRIRADHAKQLAKAVKEVCAFPSI